MMILTKRICASDANSFLRRHYRTRRTNFLNLLSVYRDDLFGLIPHIHSLLVIMTRAIGRT